jgi:hypothetical protein
MPSARLLFVLILSLASPLRAETVEVRDVIGVAHAGGKYSLTKEDFLNEGADQILAFGSRVIKVWLNPNPELSYPFNSDWGGPALDVVELVQRPYYQELFEKPFTTYFLVLLPAPTPSGSASQFLDGMTPEEAEAERDQAYRLARHLLSTYAGTGKTFVLQNWEGDHLLRAGLPRNARPDAVRIQGMVEWLNARQAGVDQARREANAQEIQGGVQGVAGVAVYHAVEANLLRDAMRRRVTVTNHVIPFTRADLYSYSSWDIGFNRRQLTKALDYLADKAPDTPSFGAKNIYLGEFGASRFHAGGEAKQKRVIVALAEAALGWGVRWALYWQVYCNEPAHTYGGRPENGDMRGLWLVRPDGSRAAMWNGLGQLLKRTVSYVSVSSYSGQYLSAEEGQGFEDLEEDAVTASQWSRGAREVFALVDWNGGGLQSGDAVSLLSRYGLYVSAEGWNGGGVFARAEEAGETETFVLRKMDGDGPIRPGDPIALETASGRFLGAEVGGDGVRNGRWEPGPAETFRLLAPE